MVKTCIQCGKEFKKAYTSSRKYFSQQKFCGQQCFGIFFKGKARYKITEETKNKLSIANKDNKTGIENGITTRFQKGLKHTEEWRKIMSKKLSGRNCYAWKGGVTPVYEKIRKSLKMREWKKQVLERDDYRCRDCGKKGGDLEVDHVYQFAYYPLLRFEVLNGQTLCKRCHLQKTIFERVGKMELIGENIF